MATMELENLFYRKRNIVYAFVRHRLMVLMKQSVRDVTTLLHDHDD